MRRSSIHLRASALLASSLVTLLSAASARAEPTIEVETRGELAFGDEVLPAPGLEATFGWALDTYPLLLVPEVALSGTWHPTIGQAGVVRALAGGRVGLTTLVEPAIYVHGGYGAWIAGEGVVHGGAIDAGLAVDKRLSRDLTLGGALGYQGLFAGRSTLHGLAAGFHIGFWL